MCSGEDETKSLIVAHIVKMIQWMENLKVHFSWMLIMKRKGPIKVPSEIPPSEIRTENERAINLGPYFSVLCTDKVNKGYWWYQRGH